LVKKEFQIYANEVDPLWGGTISGLQRGIKSKSLKRQMSVEVKQNCKYALNRQMKKNPLNRLGKKTNTQHTVSHCQKKPVIW
jgi:hypothetical protein